MTPAVFYVLWIFISINLVYGYDYLYPTCVDTEEEANGFSEQLISDFTIKPYISSDALTITDSRRKKYCIWYFLYLRNGVKISFEKFNLTDGIGCPTEYLAFKFNGDIRKDLKFCGSSYPKVLYLSSHSIKIIYTFNPDLSETGKGFRLRIEKSSELCETNQQLNVGNTPLYIALPGYPAYGGFYGRYIDIHCSWEFNATDQKEAILLEFLLFDPKILNNAQTTSDKSTCYINGLEVEGSKKYIKLCDVEYNKLIIKSTNRTVSIRFTKKWYAAPHNGFMIKYYSVPKYDYGCTGQTDSKTLTAYRGRPQVVNVIGTSGKICSWNIVAENPSDVIIYELQAYKTKTYNCFLTLRITEENSQVSNPLGVYTCIEESVKYYRSSTSNIKIDMLDTARYFYFEHSGGLSFSFYSVPQDVLTDSVMVITTIPSYIWIPGLSSQTRKDVTQSAILKSQSYGKCIQVKGLTANLSVVDNLYDYINVYDGYNDYVNEITATCRMKFDSVTGSNTSMLIKIRPNYINAGIWIKAEVTDTCVLNSNLKYLTVGNIAKVIESPGYPHSFYCYQYLYWPITTESKNKVISLSTDPHLNTTTKRTYCRNELVIYDGSDSSGDVISRFCLGTKGSFVSSGRVMYLTLIAHSTIEPFKLLLSQRNKVECSDGSRTATATPQYVTSPFYPGHYPNSMYCKWYITSNTMDRIKVEIHHLELGNKPNTCGDYLGLYDDFPQSSKICNNRTVIISFVTKYTWLRVEFNSDASYAAKGFNISYELIRRDGDCNQDFVVDLSPRYLQSTNYPGMYTRGVECTYRLNKATTFDSNYNIVVSVVDCVLPTRIHQQCTSDYVNVYDGPDRNSQDKVGTFCGNENKFIVSAKSISVLIDFVSAKRGSTYYEGFKIKYILESITVNKKMCSAGPPLELTASATVQYFTSPNYPNNYRNDQYCQWRISSSYKKIHFEVIDSNLGPKPTYGSEDYVKVYDGYTIYDEVLGKVYSTHTPTYVSSGFNLFIEFNSNSNGVYKGFKVKYYTSDSVPEKSGSSDPSYGVVAGVISCITLFCIFICVCLCRFFMKRKTPPPRQPRSNRQSVVFNTSNNAVFVVPPVHDANSTSSPPPYAGVSNPGYDIAASSYPGNIPSVAPPPYSELPSYEDSAEYEIPETRSHPESNRVPEPQRQISREDLRIRINPPQFQVRRRNNSTQSIDSQENLALAHERGVTGIDNQISHPN